MRLDFDPTFSDLPESYVRAIECAADAGYSDFADSPYANSVGGTDLLERGTWLEELEDVGNGESGPCLRVRWTWVGEDREVSAAL